MRKVLLIILIVLTIFLRFYNLENLTTFTGEEGRDFITVKQIITGEKFTLLGPRIGPYNNISEVHLGPFYYYLIAPALFLSNLDPVGPAILMALLSSLSVFMMFYLGKKFFNDFVAFTAAFLYSVAPILANQGRASNPAHFIPVIAPFLLYCLLQVLIKNNGKYLIAAGFLSGALGQFHLTTVSALLAIIVLRPKVSWKYWLWGIIGFLIVTAPQIVFELRHEFFTVKAILAQFQTHNNFADFKLPLIFLGLILILIKFKQKSPLVMLIIFILVNLFCVSIYSGSWQYHYLGLSFAPLALAIAIILNKRWIISLLLVLFLSIKNDPNRNHGFNMTNGWTLPGIKTMTQVIAADLDSTKNNNLVSTLDADSRGWPYRYLLNITGKTISGVQDYPTTKVLYLISRNGQLDVDASNLWEIRSFGPSKIVKSWPVQNGINLYKVISVPSAPQKTIK